MRETLPSQVEFCCAACGEGFFVRADYCRHREKKGLPPPKYCTRTCMGVGQRVKFTAETILDRSIPEPNSGCWLWLGSVNPGNGYSRLRHEPAHRVSYSLFVGEIPKGQVVRHRCDNPLCVNPDHLLVGTALDNKMDAVSRGRHARGETIGSAVLAENDVHEIRARLAKGISQSEVARAFGVKHAVVHRIAHGVTWRHLGVRDAAEVSA